MSSPISDTSEPPPTPRTPPPPVINSANTLRFEYLQREVYATVRAAKPDRSREEVERGYVIDISDYKNNEFRQSHGTSWRDFGNSPFGYLYSEDGRSMYVLPGHTKREVAQMSEGDVVIGHLITPYSERDEKDSTVVQGTNLVTWKREGDPDDGWRVDRFMGGWTRRTDLDKTQDPPEPYEVFSFKFADMDTLPQPLREAIETIPWESPDQSAFALDRTVSDNLWPTTFFVNPTHLKPNNLDQQTVTLGAYRYARRADSLDSA